jgi:isochorismate synthase
MESRVLVSLVQRINSVDPLGVLQALHRAASSERGLRQLAARGCAYWARPSEGFAIAAFGAAAVLSPSGPERFATLNQEWSSLLQHAQVDGPVESARGVGPLLIGGFSFEPDGPPTQTWRGFPAAHMIVPEFHVTSVGNESWLTISAIVGGDRSFPTDSETAAIKQKILGAESTNHAGEAAARSVATNDDLPALEWSAIVGEAVTAIRAGEMQKVVLARSVSGQSAAVVDPLLVLRNLRDANRDAFVYGYWRGDAAFVGASPERLVRVEDGRVSASSLAGTVRRGATPEDDELLAQQLQSSRKDIAEHVAVRDMLHHVLSEVAENVASGSKPDVMRLSNVYHLHTEVTADLRDGNTLLDVVARLHPTPAVGGSPREAALEFIRANERLDRGWYAGPVGWIDRRGGDLAVALRSGILRGQKYTLFAGCGIVADSDPDMELAESTLKLQPMISAIGGSISATAAEAEMALASREQA